MAGGVRATARRWIRGIRRRTGPPVGSAAGATQRRSPSLEDKVAAFAPGVAERGRIIERNGQQLWGHHTSPQRWDQVALDNLVQVTDVLDGAGIDYFLVENRDLSRRIVVVNGDQRDDCGAALRDRLAGTGTYWAATGARQRPDLIVLASGPKTVTPLLVFRINLTPAGHIFAAEDAACEIHFWERTTTDTPPAGNHELFEVGSLVALTNRNRWTHVLPPSEQSRTTASVNGRTLPCLSLPERPHAFESTFPVDVVYTWVDGSDPQWRARKESALTRRPAPEGTDLSANESRYASYDELRYSLRSLDLYAPWVRRVYLVTEGHLPEWLEVSHPRLRIVRHDEIFADPTVLPTFSSRAIESQLYRIPELSEHFLYLNDDMLFSSPTPKETFFAPNGISYFFPSPLPIGFGALREEDTPVVQAAKANRDLVAQLAGVEITQRMQHAPYPLRVSVLKWIAETWPDQVARTAASRFRSPGDLSIVSSLAHYVGLVRGTAVPGKVRYLYTDVADPGTPERLADLLQTRRHQVLCLNDTKSDPASHSARAAMIGAFLEDYYPTPGAFEKTP